MPFTITFLHLNLNILHRRERTFDSELDRILIHLVWFQFRMFSKIDGIHHLLLIDTKHFVNLQIVIAINTERQLSTSSLQHTVGTVLGERHVEYDIIEVKVCVFFSTEVLSNHAPSSRHWLLGDY